MLYVICATHYGALHNFRSTVNDLCDCDKRSYKCKIKDCLEVNYFLNKTFHGIVCSLKITCANSTVVERQ